jgi:uncharacterized membrane protein YeaQ/YmgE (transglycosylase-associated protein family)
MGLIVVLVIGASLGWMIRMIVRRGPEPARFPAVTMGVAGALLGAFMLGPRLGGGNLLEAEFDSMTPIVALLGVAGLFAFVFLVRRLRRRPRNDADASLQLEAHRQGDR